MLLTLQFRRIAGSVFHTVLFLFFLQLVTIFVEAIYAFGLLGTGIPLEIVAVLLFFSPVMLLIAPRSLSERLAPGVAFMMMAGRLIAPLLDTRGRMLVSGVGVAAALIWLPLLLWGLGLERDRSRADTLPVSLLIAVLLSILLRVAGSSLDLSTRGFSQFLGWLLAALAVAAHFLAGRITGPAAEGAPAHVAKSTVSFGRLLAWVLGLNSVLILLYFIFTSPGVTARWTGAGYPAIVVTLVSAIAVFAVMHALRPDALRNAAHPLLWILNAGFVLALANTLFIQQIRFAQVPAGYPLYAPDAPWFAPVSLFAMLLLAPIVFVNFALYVRAFATARPSPRALGAAFTLGSLYWVMLIFAHIFTTVYDYIPVIGPAFRDRFWLVHLVVGLGMVLPLLSVRQEALSWQPSGKLPVAWAVGAVVLGALAVVGVLVTAARPGGPSPQSTLTVLTYNIQQGYREDGQYGTDDQLALMRDVDADLIGLQESDACRIAGGNVDLVRYYADELNMHAYYGPTPVAGTFGIALLSKYPIENPRTFYMYSEGEQTATIEARITLGQETINVFVTHLGNGGPMVQQEAIMQVVTGKENVVLMGDFNFRPGTEQYALTTAVFDDAWLRRWPDGVDDQGVTPPKRIDHIFISPSIQVEDSRFIHSPASDHPAVTALLRLE
jgi:endonuclease/exonuclease/phosphatase family metal-dependent hydrolase